MLSTKALFTGCSKAHLPEDTHSIKQRYLDSPVNMVLQSDEACYNTHTVYRMYRTVILHALLPSSSCLLIPLLPPPPCYNPSSNNNLFNEKKRAEGEKGFLNITSFFSSQST